MLWRCLVNKDEQGEQYSIFGIGAAGIWARFAKYPKVFAFEFGLRQSQSQSHAQCELRNLVTFFFILFYLNQSWVPRRNWISREAGVQSSSSFITSVCSQVGPGFSGSFSDVKGPSISSIFSVDSTVEPTFILPYVNAILLTTAFCSTTRS